MHSILISHLARSPLIAYIIIGIGAAFDGEPFLFAAAFLAYRGIISTAKITIIIFFMTVIGDMGWYYLGTQFKYLPRILKLWISKLAGPFDMFMKRHPAKLFFISKFAYGIHHALWARAGSLSVPLKRLVLVDLIATALWMILAGGIAYSFSASFSEVTRYIGYVEIGLLVGIVVFVYIQYLIGRYVTKRLKEERNAP